MDKHEYAVDKYPLNPDKPALDFANGDSVWKEVKQNWQELPRRTKIALVAGTIAVLGVMGKVGHDDAEAAKLTEQNNQKIYELVENHRANGPFKGGDVITDEIGNAIQYTMGPDGEYIYTDLSTGEVIDGPNGNDVLVPGNDGQKAVDIEREANNP